MCACALVLMTLAQPIVGAALFVLPAIDVARGLWRTGPFTRRTVEAAAAAEEADDDPAAVLAEERRRAERRLIEAR
jgi:hypothetical protein